MLDISFYKNKRILITGHTGFKGSWLCEMLVNAGADVVGYALNPPTAPALFELLNLDKKMTSIIGDIRDLENLKNVFSKYQPEIVIHLAAQPIVRDGYKNPVYTYETNVMGTVNICECIRLNPCVKSFLNVTTDKVYQNNEWEYGYRENDPLNGYDPYSNSKSCSELITQSYVQSFFSSANTDTAVSTARAGNVIGGGDFANDRIIPDCIRAVEQSKDIIVRNPNSTRPYQHVLEPLTVYLEILQKQYLNSKYASSYNIGPDDCDCITTGELVSMFCNKWENIRWRDFSEKNAPHEANFLKLDCSKLKKTFDWKPKYHINEAMDKIIEWYRIYINKGNLEEITDKQIKEYLLKK